VATKAELEKRITELESQLACVFSQLAYLQGQVNRQPIHPMPGPAPITPSWVRPYVAPFPLVGGSSTPMPMPIVIN